MPEPLWAGDPFPLTAAQQALMIGRSAEIDFGGVGCYGYFEWDRTSLDADRMTAAWRALVRRHDMLRTVAEPLGTQRTLSVPPEFDVPVLDLSAHDPAAARLRTEELRDTLSHQVFPAGGWPLFDFRITLIPGGSGRIHLGVDLQLADAASLFQVLFPDLVDLYEHPETELPALGLCFGEYVRRHAETARTSPEYLQDRAYWMDRLDSLPSAPALPAGQRPEGPVRFDRREFRMPAETWKRFESYAVAGGLTPSVALTAAFAEVVSAWSAAPEFAVNYPVFRRPKAPQGIDRVFGDFTNIVLLQRSGREARFLDRAQAMQRQLDADLAHGGFNGVEVLRELARSQGTGARTAMPVVVTSLLDYPARRPVTDLGEEVYSLSQTPQVTLDVQLRELGGELRVIWDFVVGEFAPGFVDAAFTAYVALLTRLSDEYAAWRAEGFDLVPAVDRELRQRVNSTDGAVPDVLLHELLAEQAARTPDAEAVVASGRRLSYAELVVYANRIARRLRADGVRPGDLVAIVMEKGWEQYAAVYGVLGSGAAYLPLEAGVPRDRLHALLAQGAVRAVLTQKRLDESVEWPDPLPRHRVDVDFEDGDSSAPPSVQQPTDLAYVIFTSGTTGESKGVMVDHRGVVNLVADVNRRFGVGQHDRLLAISGLHFDASVYDLYGPLAAGGTVVVPEPFDRAVPHLWVDLVAAERVTFWNSVPVLMELLVGQAEIDRGAKLASLRIAVLSGDWIPLTLPDRLRSQSPSIYVVGSGGPTETICWSLFYSIGRVDPAWKSIPYGRPITNQRYYIVDDRLRDRPVGVVGEMAVASDIGLAHGYWSDPERTAARFVTLPETGQRAYLTGDLGRYLPDGDIEILGRDDFQVKIQGRRVELGEIEAALRADPAVRSAVVVAPGGAHGMRRLHGFVVTDGSADVAGLTARIGERLPSELVPKALVVLDAWPLTGNGKVDRLALMARAAASGPEPETRSESGSEAVGGPVERVVRVAVADILGVSGVVAADNFFRLGGDSLSGTRLATLLGDLLNVPVSIKAVFDHPELAELAELIAGDAADGAAATAAAEDLLFLLEHERRSAMAESEA
jgi:pyochelin synthetase